MVDNIDKNNEAIAEPEGIRSAAARGVAPAARGDGPDGRGPEWDICPSRILVNAKLFASVAPAVIMRSDAFAPIACAMVAFAAS